jgi:hypothetical protein
MHGFTDQRIISHGRLVLTRAEFLRNGLEKLGLYTESQGVHGMIVIIGWDVSNHAGRFRGPL